MDKIDNKKIFAKNLSYHMNKCGKDQKELAEIVGVAYSTFNEWVNAKKYPRIDKIEILANYFGILKSDLIEEKNFFHSELTLSEEEKSLIELFRCINTDKQRLALQLISELTLSEEEKSLIELFRCIPDDKREFALQMVRFAAGK